MIDRYTKAVLTVIAGCLIALVGQNALQPAFAIGDGCGGRFDPCYIEYDGRTGLSVYVTNMP